MEDGSSSIDFLRRIVARLGHYRHFPAITADYAFHFIDRRLLGKSFAALSQLALSSPPFWSHHTKLGKQRRRPAQSQNLRHQHDELILHLHVLALPRTMVDRRGIDIGLRLRRCLDVVASRTLSRVQNPIFNYSASLAEYHAATNYPQTKLLIPIYIEY